MTVIFRCGLCDCGVHPGDAIHLRDIDELVCPRCDDHHTDIMRALTWWLEHFTTACAEEVEL